MKTTLLLLLVIFLISCNSPQKQSTTNKDNTFTIIDKVKTDLSYKAQLVIYAYLKNDLTDKKEIKNALNLIYESNRHESGYSNFSEPTVIGVYLFTSENMAKTNKAEWIGMLMKAPNDVEPRISYNELKINALIGLKDGKKSKDEVELEKLNKLLTARHLELCSFSKILDDLYLESIHKADKAFPNYGREHDAYQEQLENTSIKKIKKKYNLTDSDITTIGVFANSYCN